MDRSHSLLRPFKNSNYSSQKAELLNMCGVAPGKQAASWAKVLQKHWAGDWKGTRFSHPLKTNKTESLSRARWYRFWQCENSPRLSPPACGKWFISKLATQWNVLPIVSGSTAHTLALRSYCAQPVDCTLPRVWSLAFLGKQDEMLKSARASVVQDLASTPVFAIGNGPSHTL